MLRSGAPRGAGAEEAPTHRRPGAFLEAVTLGSDETPMSLAELSCLSSDTGQTSIN